MRAEGATHPHTEDAKSNQQEALLSLADMLLESQTKAGRLKKLDKAQAVEEELDQAAPRSPTFSPRKEQQEEEGTPAATTHNCAQPKAPGCVPNEEQTGSKRQKPISKAARSSDAAGCELPQEQGAKQNSQDAQEPKGPPKAEGDQKEEEVGD